MAGHTDAPVVNRRRVAGELPERDRLLLHSLRDDGVAREPLLAPIELPEPQPDEERRREDGAESEQQRRTAHAVNLPAHYRFSGRSLRSPPSRPCCRPLPAPTCD